MHLLWTEQHWCILQIHKLIHSADPVTTCSDHYFAHLEPVPPSQLFKISHNKTDFKSLIVVATDGTVGLAEVIIDDTHVLFSLFSLLQQFCSWVNCQNKVWNLCEKDIWLIYSFLLSGKTLASRLIHADANARWNEIVAWLSSSPALGLSSQSPGFHSICTSF